MVHYQITIPNEKESMLPIFESIVSSFSKYFEFCTETKDGFVYFFEFDTEKQQDEFKQSVESKLPNLFK